jgi:serine/threonine-protein kinase
MLVTCCLSVYGTYVISTLRHEAFEAHQLNQYRLGPRLGTGGMGEVYLGEHRFLKRPCAVKVIRAGSASPVVLLRFEREVRATARLSHPNTVEIYDYGRTKGGTFFYVMEYLPGLSLDELITRHGPMPPGRVIYLLRQVCGALAEAHAAGLIHRDVKPANILACHRGGLHDVAKLLDFGLVKGIEGADADSVEAGAEPGEARSVRGTPLYMAPEQITRSSDLDHRCDIYALGAVAYKMLTGQPPFPGRRSDEVMTSQIRDPAVPPRRVRPEVPEDLEVVVLRCLSKSPAMRYPDAASLEKALASCAAAGAWGPAEAARWWFEYYTEEAAGSPSGSTNG